MVKKEGGGGLDPRLVDTFVAMLPSLVAEYAGEGPSAEPPSETVTIESGTAAVGLVPKAGDAFENIALAHREIYALYEIAQAMGTSLGVSDTMALISSKLSKLVPWSGCALFLYDSGTERLHCRFAAGVDTPRLLNTSVAVGDGLAGWVARNRRSSNSLYVRSTGSPFTWTS